MYLRYKSLDLWIGKLLEKSFDRVIKTRVNQTCNLFDFLILYNINPIARGPRNQSNCSMIIIDDENAPWMDIHGESTNVVTHMVRVL